MIVIVMGVAGSGKTALGRALAQRLGCCFLDADDFHSTQNVAKMRGQEALSDQDRQPWLTAMNQRLQAAEDCVLACSALKRGYRRALAAGLDLHPVYWIYLKVDLATAQERMKGRQHFMPVELLPSQFEALEEPTEIPGLISVDATKPVEEIVDWLVELLA